MLQYAKNFFCFDPLSMIMIFLVLFMGICVGSFAARYMKGDTQYRIFFFYLSLLIVAIGVMVTADHIFLFFGGWCLSNLLLVLLMIHKSNWKAAKNSGLLAAKNYIFGAVCIATALTLLTLATKETSIKALIHSYSGTYMVMPALILLLIGGMTQSAIIPFHRWLISSLNSPTPVSAIMHAGLVNGGGFLIVRFAPLYLEHPQLLNLMFVMGIVTALIGTFWKLMQNDVKRMLACSTMGQMGFMLAQCGLGLFPAAVAHLITHGLFKAYLFLATGSAAQEKRCDSDNPPKARVFSYSLVCGLLGSYSFSIASGKSWCAGDSTLVLMVIAFLTASQSAIPILSLRVSFRLPIAIAVTSAMSLVYGVSISLITKIMDPMQLTQPQNINGFHIVAIILLVTSWLTVLFIKNVKNIKFLRSWWIRWYVKTLNASQPHPKTITTHRNQYRYL
jgi:NAD(P)H-quinone oxidoreductase subunit 5